MLNNDAERWAFGVAGVLTQINGDNHNCLGGGERTEENVEDAVLVLSEWWGVTSREGLQETLQSLWTTGHRAEYDALVGEQGSKKIGGRKKKFLKKFGKDLEGRSLWAWDMGRLVAVAGWGFLARMLTEQEAWQWILPAAQKVQQVYKSWKHFGRHYHIGRTFWGGGDDPDDCKDAVEELLDNPGSPWSTLAWDLDLTPGGQRRVRIKKMSCVHCGGGKELPSPSAYVHCDYCGELTDWDQGVFERLGQQPVPAEVYRLSADMTEPLEEAKKNGDRETYRKLQWELNDVYVRGAPASFPPRARDAKYREAFVDFTVDNIVLLAFDAEHDRLIEEVNAANLELSPVLLVGPWDEPKLDKLWRLIDAQLQRVQYDVSQAEQNGLLPKHPDAVPSEMHVRIGMSAFVQAYSPYLSDEVASQTIARAGLAGDYEERDMPAVSLRSCCCGANIHAVPGAHRVLCYDCGRHVDVQNPETACPRCGGSCSLLADHQNVPCPYCGQMFQLD